MHWRVEGGSQHPEGETGVRSTFWSPVLMREVRENHPEAKDVETRDLS